MADVHLKYINEVDLKIEADAGIVMEIADKFRWRTPNYKYHPQFKLGRWDGYISLVNKMSARTYAGLAQAIKKYCDQSGYSITWDDELRYDNVSKEEFLKFVDSLELPEWIDIRDYQINSSLKCIQSRRRTLLSPTSSGKSLMIYFLSRWYSNEKKLIIVPTIGLVAQMEDDFKSYGFKGVIHKSTDGLDKSNDIAADIVITTWQSLDNGRTKIPARWYEQFGCVIVDECHGAQAKTIIEIMKKMKNCRYRFGTTGTLQDDLLSRYTIMGLFGPTYQAITTKQMMDRGYSSKLKIKCLVLKYPVELCKKTTKMSYQEEIDFLIGLEQRNKFIRNLALSLKENKLIFFRIRSHGEEIYKLISEATDQPVYHIDGTKNVDERERIRHAIEVDQNATLVGSLGTTSTGVNIKKLFHMIAGSPNKSKIKTLQSIGRMLRKHVDKEEHGAILYDIVDDLSHKKHQNYTLKHFIERCKIYNAEEFDYEIHNIEVKM